MKDYLVSRLKNTGFRLIKKIRGEASTRAFYRVFFRDYSLVAMLYPEESPRDIEKIVKLTPVYLQHHINVPEIIEVIENRLILLEDLGDILAQKAFSLFKPEEQKKFLETIADILIRLKEISPGHTPAVLDSARMKWEMDFFLTHFAGNYLSVSRDPAGMEDFKERLYRMVEQIRPIDSFAHRDFHSRNMLVYKNGLYLVDFQDSLVASPYYDLVSLAFDCYLDLKAQREFLLECVRKKGMVIDKELFYTTALQRNIKALGTFGFQVTVRKNLSYKKYIPRTLRHIMSNPLFEKFFNSLLFATRGALFEKTAPLDPL